MAFPERIKVMDFIQKSIGSQFVIPVYQRKYTWLANKHVKQLLLDFDSLLTGKTPSHFLGIIIYVSTDITGTYREFSVVDGQQRLTTIFLMLQALKAVAKKTGSEDEANIIEERYLINKYVPDQAKFRLKPLISEDGVYQKIASGDLSGLSDAEKNTNCYKNYEYIYDYCLSKMDEFSLDDLLVAMNKFQIVYIPLDAEDNAQQIFESINSTGVELSSADLIRNFLLMDLPNDTQERFYKQYWEVLENKLETGANVSEFFRFYLSIKKYDLIKKDEVYATFKNWQTKEITRITDSSTFDRLSVRESILQDILKYVEYYFNIYVNNENIAGLPALTWYRKNKSVMPAPFLMELYRIHSENPAELSATDFNEIIDLIDTYLVRRALCEKPTSQITRLFPSLLKNVLSYSQGTGQSILECTKYCLVNKNKNNSLKMPNDKELEEALSHNNAYSNDATRLVLEKIENFGNNIALQNLKGLSVEHLLPQTSTPYWEKKVLDGQYDDYVNLIGNLTLASGLDNSKMSNRPWIDPEAQLDKKRILENTGHLKLNMELLKLPDWNSDCIKERTVEITNKVKELYKYRESDMQQKTWKIKLKPNTEDIIVDAILSEDGTVVILPGSQCLNSLDSKNENHAELYSELLQDDIIQPISETKAEFIKDYAFTSISTAAGFLLDGSRNGWEYFWTEDDHKLDEIRKAYFSKNV